MEMSFKEMKSSQDNIRKLFTRTVIVDLRAKKIPMGVMAKMAKISYPTFIKFLSGKDISIVPLLKIVEFIEAGGSINGKHRSKRVYQWKITRSCKRSNV